MFPPSTAAPESPSGPPTPTHCSVVSAGQELPKCFAITLSRARRAAPSPAGPLIYHVDYYTGLADAKTAMNYFDLQKGVGQERPGEWLGVEKNFTGFSRVYSRNFHYTRKPTDRPTRPPYILPRIRVLYYILRLIL